MGSDAGVHRCCADLARTLRGPCTKPALTRVPRRGGISVESLREVNDPPIFSLLQYPSATAFCNSSLLPSQHKTLGVAVPHHRGFAAEVFDKSDTCAFAPPRSLLAPL